MKTLSKNLKTADGYEVLKTLGQGFKEGNLHILQECLNTLDSSDTDERNHIFQASM